MGPARKLNSKTMYLSRDLISSALSIYLSLHPSIHPPSIDFFSVALIPSPRSTHAGVVEEVFRMLFGCWSFLLTDHLHCASAWASPKSKVNAMREVPGRRPGGPSGLPGSSHGRFSDPTESWWINWRLLGRSWDVSADLLEPRETPQIHQKSRFLLKSAVQTWALCQFLCAKTFFVLFARFCIDSSRKKR